MGRIPRSRSVIANHAVHKMWRGHNREWNLGSDEQKKKYLEYLNDDIESERYLDAADLNAITVMSSHGHEIFLIRVANLFSDHMRRHHSRYGMYFNRQNNRCGKVARDRPKTCLIENAHHEMIAVFYVHANPVRAGIVGDAKDYYYSTHKLYAFGKREPWMRNVKFPEWYLKLGRNSIERQRKYRILFQRYLKDFGMKKQTFLEKFCFGSVDWMADRKKLSERHLNLVPS